MRCSQCRIALSRADTDVKLELHRTFKGSHDKVKIMKEILRGEEFGGFKDGELRDIDDVLDIWTALNERRLVGNGKYDVIVLMLRIMRHKRAAKMVYNTLKHHLEDFPYSCECVQKHIFLLSYAENVIDRKFMQIDDKNPIIDFMNIGEILNFKPFMKSLKLFKELTVKRRLDIPSDDSDTEMYVSCKQDLVDKGRSFCEAIDGILGSIVEIPSIQRRCLIDSKLQIKTLLKVVVADESVFCKDSPYYRSLISHTDQTLQQVQRLKQLTSKIYLKRSSRDMTVGRFPKEWIPTFYTTCKKILKRPQRKFTHTLKRFRVVLHRFVSNVNTENYVKLSQELLDECKKVIDAIFEQLASSDRTTAPNEKKMLRDMKTCMDELVKTLQMDNKLLVKGSNYVAEMDEKIATTLQQVERVTACLNLKKEAVPTARNIGATGTHTS